MSIKLLDDVFVVLQSTAHNSKIRKNQPQKVSEFYSFSFRDFRFFIITINRKVQSFVKSKYFSPMDRSSSHTKQDRHSGERITSFISAEKHDKILVVPAKNRK